MKFSAHVNDLRTALQTVNMALPGRTTQQILECVLLEATEDTLKLTGSDSTIQVSCSIECDAEVPGRVAIRGKMLEEIVKRMQDSEVKVEVNDKNVLAIKCGRAKSSLAGDPADQYPIKPPVEVTTKITIPAVEFCNMITATEKCIAKDDMRPVLNGGCIEVSKGVMSMIALDGFRMAVKNSRLSPIPDDCTVIIPQKSLFIVKKLLSSEGEELVDLNFSDDEFEMQIGNTNIRCVLIAGEYVKWRNLVPTKYGTICTMSAAQFAHAVDRAAFIARQGSSNLIKLSIGDNSITIYASSGYDDVMETIDADVEGASLDIAFNASYISDAIKMFDEGNVVLHLSSPVQPCIISSAFEVSDFFWLVLPVRTAA